MFCRVIWPALVKPAAAVNVASPLLSLPWMARFPYCAKELEIVELPKIVISALLVSVPDPAQVESAQIAAPAEMSAGPFTVRVRLFAEKVALAEFSVNPAMVGLASRVTA